MIKKLINWNDFEKMDIRIGTIVKAIEFEKAINHSYLIHVDFGEIGLKKTSAQITKHYTQEKMVGRQVAAVVNFPPKQIGKFMSEVLVLGFPDMQNEVVLLHPSIAVPDGGRLF